jgi:hypothetical protein
MSWELTGNAGIDPTTNFLGTTDNNPLIIKTNGTDQLRVYSGGKGGPNVEIIGGVAIDYSLAIGNIVGFASNPNLTVAGPDATVNIETAEILRVMRHGVSGVKNQNSAGLFVGAFESGENGRSRLDINVAGAPGNSNTWGSVPDVTVMSLLGNGNVGFGTTNPTQQLQVTGQGFFTSSSASPDPGDSSGTGIRIGYQGTDDYGYINANTTGLAAKRLILQQNGGNVGIGTTDAGATLEVRGGSYGITCKGIDVSLHAHHLTTDNAVYLATGDLAGDFYGDVRVSGDVILTGADCAEEFEIAEAAEIEPGTVMVLDQDGALHQCHQAYDKRVAGVISGAGEYKPGLILDRRQSEDYRVPVALVGKVYCKVDAQYAAIKVGDLLTTSPTPGHAMKADDPIKAFGSVVGKALRPLETGEGLVPILIALQ